MAANEEETDELGIDLEVFVKDGQITEVRKNGVQVRARVIDYDVEFPCVANALKLDSENNLYMEFIV